MNDKLEGKIKKLKSIIKIEEEKINLAKMVSIYENNIKDGLSYKTIHALIQEDLCCKINFTRLKLEIGAHFKSLEQEIIKKNIIIPDETGNVYAWYKIYKRFVGEWQKYYKPIFNLYYGSVKDLPKNARTFTKEEYEMAQQFDQKIMKAFSEYDYDLWINEQSAVAEIE